MRKKRNDRKAADSLLSQGKGVVKSRSLLGHFHRLRFASGSQKAHKPKGTPQVPWYASGCMTGFYNRNDNYKTNRYEQYTIRGLPPAAWQRQ